MKNLVRIACLMLVFVMVCVVFVGCNQTEETDNLVIYNWADYIYDYEDDFKAYYRQMTGKNVEITYVTFDTNETMLTKITKGDSNVDVICPSEYAIQQLMEKDLLVPLNYANEAEFTKGINFVDGANYQHNYGKLDANVINKINDAFGSVTNKITGKTEAMLDYMVPYMYGTLGILYNRYAFIDAGIISVNEDGSYDATAMNQANWGVLFNDNGKGELLSDSLTNSILMKDSIRDSYAATVFYLLESGVLDQLVVENTSSEYYGKPYSEIPAGVLINMVDENLIEACKVALSQQKQELFGYEVDFGKDDLLVGNAIVDLAWSGDALYAFEESWNDDLNDGEGDYELAYYVPHTTGNIWFDGWVVPKGYNPKNLDAIKLFINFMNNPYSSAANMYAIGYTSALDPNAIMADQVALGYLAEGYAVYGYAKDDDGNLLPVDKCDFANIEEFNDYFFYMVDPVDNSNWRYPFMFADEENQNFPRNINTLGVMRDFGDKNKDVVVMWNYVRSAAVSSWQLLLWTVVVVGVTIGVIALIRVIILKRRMNVIINK
ncbi:MAG: extracellular solute-binding protein [Clostridia bacterium]|nr:extracellular solute-binding protein [Clostridia bacterium]MBQ8772648.1 extracellular solute-binding protein [Clostridia bacterium]